MTQFITHGPQVVSAFSAAPMAPLGCSSPLRDASGNMLLVVEVQSEHDFRTMNFRTLRPGEHAALNR